MAVPIGERAGAEQERREGDRVDIEHPLQGGEGGAEVDRHVGQGDVDDGDVYQEHEGAEADGEEGHPLVLFE